MNLCFLQLIGEARGRLLQADATVVVSPGSETVDPLDCTIL
jgi:hypothetical protein